MTFFFPTVRAHFVTYIAVSTEMLAQLVRGLESTLGRTQQDLGRAQSTSTQDNNVGGDKHGRNVGTVFMQENGTAVILPLKVDHVGSGLVGSLLGLLDANNITASIDLGAVVPGVGDVVEEGGVFAPVIDSCGIVAGEGTGLLVDSCGVEGVLEVDGDRWTDKFVVGTCTLGLGLEGGEFGEDGPVLGVRGGLEHVDGVLEGLLEKFLVLGDLLGPGLVVPETGVWP